MSADDLTHEPVLDQLMDPDDDPDECRCRRRDCDDCGIGPDDARDYDDD